MSAHNYPKGRGIRVATAVVALALLSTVGMTAPAKRTLVIGGHGTLYRKGTLAAGHISAATVQVPGSMNPSHAGSMDAELAAGLTIGFSLLAVVIVTVIMLRLW